MKNIFADWNMNKTYKTFIFFLVVFIFVFANVRIYGFSLYPDEFGYWASAAHVAGYDWSKIASIGSYYSYGYSLILIPILLVASGSTAYKLAVAVNFILMVVGYFLMYRIVRILYPQIDEVFAAIASGIGLFFPTWIFYSQMTMVEAYLIFLYVLIAYIVTKIFTEDKNILWYIIFGILTGYLQMVHIRTLGLVIACALTVLINAIRIHKLNKKHIAFFISLVIVFILSLILKDYVQQTVYAHANAQLMSANDFSGQKDNIRDILTIVGIRKFIESVIGKSLYILVASFGLVSFLVIALVRNLKENHNLDIYVFLILSVLGMTAVCSIYKYDATIVDGLIFGRYSEFVLPVVMAVGLCEVYIGEYKYKTSIVATLVTLVCLMVVIYVLNRDQLELLRGYHAVAMSYFNDTDMGYSLQIALCTIIGIVMLWLSVLLTNIVSSHEDTHYLLLLIIAIEIMGGYIASSILTYKVNFANYEFLRTVNQIRDESTSICYVTTRGMGKYGPLIQYSLPDKDIDVVVIEPEEYGEEMVYDESTIDVDSINADYVYLDCDTVLLEYTDILREKYPKNKRTGIFEVFYR